MKRARRSSLHQIHANKKSTESDIVNPWKPSIKSTSRSGIVVGCGQTPIRRSPRFLPSESDVSSEFSSFYEKSVDSNLKSLSISSKQQQKALCRQGVDVINQLKLSSENFGGDLEEVTNGCRRSTMLGSESRAIDFVSPLGFPHVSGRRQSGRLLGIAPVSSEDVKQGVQNCKTRTGEDSKKLMEVDCNIVNSQILRRSVRLASLAGRNGKEMDGKESNFNKSNTYKSQKMDRASMSSLSSSIRMSSRRLTTTSNGEMKRGVTLNLTDKKEEVAERLDVDGGNLILERGIDDDNLGIKAEKVQKEKRKLEEDDGVKNMIEKTEIYDCHFTVVWTKEQEEALQKAYLIAKPSPHFWKKVSRMVPGKSAQECFDKIHASIATPLPSQPRLRTRRQSLSPICNFSLSGIISPQVSKLEEGRLRRTKTTKFAAQKTVRHLLRKHLLSDLNKAIDRFSLLESSPINITSNVPDIRSPETSSSTSNSSPLPQQPVEKLPCNSKMLSRFKLLASVNNPSPEVLKRIKNRALHDQYIDQLHHREARRVIIAKKLKSGALCKSGYGDMKAARAALISDAVSFISHFRESQANTAHELELGEYDDYYDEDADIDDDDDDDVDG